MATAGGRIDSSSILTPPSAPVSGSQWRGAQLTPTKLQLNTPRPLTVREPANARTASPKHPMGNTCRLITSEGAGR
ncbi:hypothetical protein QWA68_003162 [Fusarium oxysporum]|nr:hypothetical protein QWA68_003162 [Fusarium oxysporum]